MTKKYLVTLTPDERTWLTDLISAGKRSALAITRARIRFAERGPEEALGRKPQGRPRRARKPDGRAEARLIALACSAPPDGRAAWTLQLLADKLVELRIVDAVSDETVRRCLKKTSSSRG